MPTEKSEGLKLLISEYGISYDGGDQWGSVMSWLFPVADKLYWEGHGVPEAWGYSPGMADGPDADDEDYPASLLHELEHLYTPADLVAFGEILNEEADLLKKEGKDY